MSARRPARLVAAAALAGLMASGPPAAAEPAGASFGADDPAAIGCALFTEMHGKAPTGTERQFYNWAQGYFAGRSAAAPAAARALPGSGPARRDAFRKLLAFCAGNPSASFGTAVLAAWDSGG
ncbi:MAG: hypothetical protein ABL989_13225 [Gammaproteobacteria bacterium]